MELWIRSQDKEKLIKTKNISIFWENDWFIVGNITNDLQEFKDVIVLGQYKSKERALEVLDEIQRTIVARMVVNLDYKASLSSFDAEKGEEVLKKIAIYEMPEE